MISKEKALQVVSKRLYWTQLKRITQGKKMNFSIPVKNIVLTAIANKGTAQVRLEAQAIADECMATKGAVLNWIRKVEKGEVAVR